MELAPGRKKLILLLMIMTPGIPEYLTGSSRISTILFNPSFFVVQTLINLGMYTSGALLIREFVLRHDRGWLSVLLLGLAYGIMEEGVAVHTFFLASGNPVGLLGSYGRYAGIDWLWAAGISSFHSVYSITLPLLILNLAFPSTSRQNLLGPLGYRAVFVLYCADIAFTDMFATAITGSSPPAMDLGLFTLAALAIVVIASLVPRRYLAPRSLRDRSSGTKLFLLGALVLPIYFLYNGVIPGVGPISPAADLLFLVLAYLIVLRLIFRNIRPGDKAKTIAPLVYGILAPLLVFAVLGAVSLADPSMLLPILVALYLIIRFNRIVRKNENGTVGSERYEH